MSFRKRNTVLSGASHQTPSKQERQLARGVRPSPRDGRLTASTGTASLDGLLAGFGGLALGTSLLLEEQGTTDFTGVLLKCYAAEGLLQGHTVHLLGFGEAWKHELPAVSSLDGRPAGLGKPAADKLKIAWRYDALGNREAGGSLTKGL